MRPTKNKPKNKLSVKTRSPRKPAVNKPARPKRAELSEDILLGRNAVREAIKSGRSINRILIAEG